MLKNFKNSISLFYIVFILLVKVVGLHALSHDDDHEDHMQHCELCDISTVFNFIPLLDAESVHIPKTNYFVVAQSDNNKLLDVAFNNKHLSSYLQTRPPPQFL